MEINHKLHIQYILGSAGLALVFLTSSLSAGFKRLIRDQDLLPKNNVQECNKEIKARILNLSATEKVSFACDAGIIIRLCVPSPSSIYPDWKSFVINNPVLLGLKDNEYKFFETDGQTNLVQTWRGLDIRNTGVLRENLSVKDQRWFCMRPYTIDTSGWKLNVKPSISSATAVDSVLSYCETSLPKPQRTGINWSSFVKILTTEKTQPSCEMTGVVLEIAQSASHSPILIWKISGKRNHSDGKDDIYCEIDAHTGLPAFGPCK